MRILCLTPWWPANPDDTTGQFVLHSVQALAELGHSLQVLVCEPWRPPMFGRLHSDWRDKLRTPQPFPGVDVEYVNYLSAPRHLAQRLTRSSFSLLVGRHLERLIDRWNPDILHGHTEITADLLADTGARRGLPVAVTLHGVNTAPALQRPGYLRRVGRALSKITRVVLVGEALREPFGAVCGRQDHFRVVWNGFLPPSEQPPPRSFPHGLLRVISVSNLHEGKGIDIALRALAGLHLPDGRDWRYRIVGAGRERDALIALARELGILDRVDFAGHCSPRQVYGHLAAADVFVLPSYREAFGIAYAEAMASGLLTIGVRGQGPEAFIHDGVNGHLVPPQDVDALRGLLEDIARHPERSARLADQGQRTALGALTWPCHARRLLAVFEEATA